MPPHHTHLGNRFFEFEYIEIIQDSFPLMLSFRNVTLRSHNTVSERDTPIQLSHYLFHQAFFIQGVILNREGSRLEIQHSHNFRPTTNHTIKTYNHTIKYIGDFTISLNTYQSLFRVYLSNRNKP